MKLIDVFTQQELISETICTERQHNFNIPKSTKKTWNINFRNGESSILQITSSFDQQRHAARHRLIVMKRAAIDHCYMYTRQNGNVICC